MQRSKSAKKPNPKLSQATRRTRLSRPNVREDTRTMLPLLNKPKDVRQLSEATHYPAERIQKAMRWAIEQGLVTQHFQKRYGTLVETWTRSGT